MICFASQLNGFYMRKLAFNGLNNSKWHSKLLQNEKDVKVNKIDMPENPPLAELNAVKLGDYYDLAAFRAKILQIKEAVTHNLNSGFHHTRPGCWSNYN